MITLCFPRFSVFRGREASRFGIKDEQGLVFKENFDKGPGAFCFETDYVSTKLDPYHTAIKFHCRKSVARENYISPPCLKKEIVMYDLIVWTLHQKLKFLEKFYLISKGSVS